MYSSEPPAFLISVPAIANLSQKPRKPSQSDCILPTPAPSAGLVCGKRDTRHVEGIPQPGALRPHFLSEFWKSHKQNLCLWGCGTRKAEVVLYTEYDLIFLKTRSHRQPSTAEQTCCAVPDASVLTAPSPA